MMDSVHPVGASGASAPKNKLKKAYQTQGAVPGQDKVELSADVLKLRGADGVRMDKVMAVKRAIAEGTYLTPERLDQALDRAIDDAWNGMQAGKKK